MTRQRFEYLFNLYKTGSLSPEERRELNQAFREDAYDDRLQKDFLRLLQQDEVHTTWSPDLESDMWQQILQGRQPASHPAPVTKAPAHRYIFRATAMAASILIAVALIWWLQPSPKHSLPATAGQVSIANVRPGGDKAMLTLADGSRIELDSAQNGQIAQQGHATISKSNGILSVSMTNGSQSLRSSKASGDNAAMAALITTPRGGQYLVVLPDGSKVWLNSSSSLKFPTVFNGKQRHVELTGEGYFEIAKNPSMPFSVSVNNMNIQVLGTSFDAMAYPDENTINTTLLQGAVVVSEGDKTHQLQPGQQARLGRTGHELSITEADLQKTIAWKNGLFEFDHTDLPAIMRQLARWYDIEIVYKATPDKTPLGGSISKKLGLSEVLDLLAANGINHFKIEGKKVFVLP